MEWQPIETLVATEDAPSGDPKFIVWVPRGGDRGKGCCAFAYTYLDHDGRTVVKAPGFIGDWEYTHWMPVPKPPLPTANTVEETKDVE